MQIRVIEAKGMNAGYFIVVFIRLEVSYLFLEIVFPRVTFLFAANRITFVKLAF